jgi:hypothetical protein
MQTLATLLMAAPTLQVQHPVSHYTKNMCHCCSCQSSVHVANMLAELLLLLLVLRSIARANTSASFTVACMKCSVLLFLLLLLRGTIGADAAATEQVQVF